MHKSLICIIPSRLSGYKSGFESMVKKLRLMTVIVLLSFLKISELVRFCRLNKACFQMIQSIVNFQVFFNNWGLYLTPAKA